MLHRALDGSAKETYFIQHGWCSRNTHRMRPSSIQDHITRIISGVIKYRVPSNVWWFPPFGPMPQPQFPLSNGSSREQMLLHSEAGTTLATGFSTTEQGHVIHNIHKGICVCVHIFSWCLIHMYSYVWTHTDILVYNDTVRIHSKNGVTRGFPDSVVCGNGTHGISQTSMAFWTGGPDWCQPSLCNWYLSPDTASHPKRTSALQTLKLSTFWFSMLNSWNEAENRENWARGVASV